MARILDVMIENGDFVELSSKDDYAKYFNHMNRVCTMLMVWYKHLIEGGDAEAKYIEEFLSKLLFNIKMWRMKHLYDSSHDLPLDLNGSGFPNSLAMMELESDLSERDRRVETLTPANMLMSQMVDEMVERRRDPVELLRQMAERTYYESIGEGKLFLQYTHGGLSLIAEKEDHRKYIFSWACFDPIANIPYCHVLAFDQDAEADRLELYGDAYVEFLKTVKAEGTRPISVGIMAMNIDNALKTIRPKVLKRTRIGPVLCPRFSREKKPETMIELLRKYGEENDFAVRIMSEIVFSGREEKNKGSFLDFGRAKRVRQIFAIPTSDLRCFSQQASKIFDNLILPHHVLQQVLNDPLFAEYAKMGHIAYNKEGELYVV